MPQWADPDRGWIATANNRPAPDDFPYPLSGCWSDSQRAVRIRQMIEDRPKHSRDDCAAMHQDALSIRAVKCLPGLLAALQSSTDHQVQKAARLLYGWDGRMEPESTAAMVFEVFFARWTESVARERFEGEMASFLTGAASGLASALLREDVFGWLAPGRRESAIQGAMAAALHWLTEHLGPDMYQWHWGKLHVLTLRHVLSGRGDLGQLLDHGGVPVKGNFATVCNTGIGANFEAPTGATYRLIADLSASPAGLWAVDSQSESGQPGSRHYGDQLETWREGKYHFLPLDPAEAAKATQTRLMLEPGT
jgi:penicillin amidase